MNNLKNGIDQMLDDSQIEIGQRTTYKPWGRTPDNPEYRRLEMDVPARKLHNGLLIHTKKEPKEQVYAGNKGIYKVVDEDTGLMVGFVKDFDDGVRLSQDEKFIDMVNRARDLYKRNKGE